MTKLRPLLLPCRLLIASVWIFHGCYSKLLDGIPRHRLIVERILGEGIGKPAVILVGILEICLGIWVLTGRWKIPTAIVQTLAIASMNTLEILLAKDLLISAPGMVALNTAFLAVIWWWATAAESSGSLPPAPGHSR